MALVDKSLPPISKYNRHCQWLYARYFDPSGCVKKTVSYLAAGGWGSQLLEFSKGRGIGRDRSVGMRGDFTAGLEAAEKGLPFMPCRGGVGTSPEINEDPKNFPDPFKGETLPWFRNSTGFNLNSCRSVGCLWNVQHCQGPGWLDSFFVGLPLEQSYRLSHHQTEQ